MSEDGFWAKDDPTPDTAGMGAPGGGAMGAPDGGASDQGGAALTPNATSALIGLVTGGLPGMHEALAAGDSDDFESDSADDFVEDPEALRKAEAAVSKWDSPFDGPRKPIDEDYVVVATQLQSGDNAGLDDVARALGSDGVDFGWDPYDPRDTVNFMPPNAGLTARRLFAIAVPASQLARAKESLYGAPPLGVTYSWDGAGMPPAMPYSAQGGDMGYGSTAPPSAGPGSDFASGAAGRIIPVTGVSPFSGGDPGLSDNERLARMAGRGTSPGLVIGIVIFALVVFAAFVAFQIVGR
jgi:hypothetical protein